jgi:spermidine synthase
MQGTRRWKLLGHPFEKRECDTHGRQGEQQRYLFELTLAGAWTIQGPVATVSSLDTEVGALVSTVLPTRPRVVWWTATAVVTGAIVMAMELTAFRLYAPYFGNSIYVWGSMISVVMLALAVGYSLGGWIADRSGNDSPLYWIIFASGVYQLAIVFLTRNLLLKLFHWGDFAGTVCATMVIFVPPMAALAMTSPFVIRLLARAGHVGITVGRVFALSTAGSIAGVLATSFWLVPQFGTRTAMEVLCVASVLIGVAGLFTRWKAAALLVLLLVPLFVVKGPVPPAAVLWSGDSAYNRIVVLQVGELRSLVLNDSNFSQTLEKLGSPVSGFYIDQFALGPMVVPAKNLLVLGMAAGGSIQVVRAVDPRIEVDAVEIDPKVVQVAHDFFALPQDDPHLHVHIADARPWLAEQTRKWNLVHVDLFQGGPWVPFYLTTVEFFELVRSRMTEDALLMVNVLDKGENRELLGAIGATLQHVFPSVQELPTEKGNYILFAFAKPRGVAETVGQLADNSRPDWQRELAGKATLQLREFHSRAGAVVFTDDKAPVEELTRRMLEAAKN